MNWFLDGLAILYMLINGAIGFKRGLLDEFGRLTGLIFSIIISTSQATQISLIIQNTITIEPWMSMFFSFSAVFVIVLVISRVITKLFKIALLSKANKWVNNSLGFIFGLIKGFFIITVFFWFLLILPLDKWTFIIEKNSNIYHKGNQLRINIVNFFGWEDPVMQSEGYIKNLVQP